MSRCYFSAGDRVQTIGGKMAGTVLYLWFMDAEDDRHEIPYVRVKWDDGHESSQKVRHLEWEAKWKRNLFTFLIAKWKRKLV